LRIHGAPALEGLNDVIDATAREFITILGGRSGNRAGGNHRTTRNRRLAISRVAG